MPVFIDSDTGFPSEIPCSGCGWPLYCCLCPSEDDENEKAVEPLRAVDAALPPSAEADSSLVIVPAVESDTQPRG